MNKYLLAAALCAVGSAQASTYSIGASGTEVTQFNYYDPRCQHGPFPGPPCVPSQGYATWNGTLSVTVNGTADGVYSGSNITSIAFGVSAAPIDSANGGFSFSYLTDGLGSGTDTYISQPVTVTILNGQVVAFAEDVFADQYTHVTFAGSDVSFAYGFDYSGHDEHHASPTQGTGSIVAVPEPQSYILMLAGFAVVGVAARRRRVK